MYKIYNSRGRVLTEKDAPLTGDNARDVQVILQDDVEGPTFQLSSDYYVWRGDRWQGVDIFGLFDYLLDTGNVLFGRTITTPEYQKVYQRAKAEKKTWRPWERRI